MEHGYFIVSLDLELMWGMKDKKTIATYGDNVLGARKAIPQILKIFSEKGIHATWAIVGLLFSAKKSDTMEMLPARIPVYHQPKLSSYNYLEQLGDDEDTDQYHYGDSLIRLISRYKHQEIASHTFSHYYCLEKGQTKEDFASDILAAKKAAERYNVEIKSLVLPRNQINKKYLDVLIENKIFAYRGTEENWLYQATKSNDPNFIRRLFKLLDTYFNLSGYHCYTLEEAAVRPKLLNLRSSRFLRPYIKTFSLCEKLKIQRIKAQMKHAAKHHLLFHLWWHPHNFGLNTEKNMENLQEILDYYLYLHQKYGFQSANMAEIAEIYLKK
ncbi:MAG: polysaccharide deacetylase family protein [Peptococcia bacterium]|jgi:hypothetical protein